MNAMEKANARLMDNRRMAGVQRILEQEIAGFMPVMATCLSGASRRPRRCPSSRASRGPCGWYPPIRCADAWRGYPQILEFQVIPGARGEGVRLVVNEHLYTGPPAAGAFCFGTGSTSSLEWPSRCSGRSPWGPVRSFWRTGWRSAVSLIAKRRPPPVGERWVERWIMPRWPSAVRIEMAPIEAGRRADSSL